MRSPLAHVVSLSHELMFRDRGINAGSKADMDDLNAALTATRIKLDDIIDSTWGFNDAGMALRHVWEGKQVGKVVIEL